MKKIESLVETLVENARIVMDNATEVGSLASDQIESLEESVENLKELVEEKNQELIHFAKYVTMDSFMIGFECAKGHVLSWEERLEAITIWNNGISL